MNADEATNESTGEQSGRLSPSGPTTKKLRLSDPDLQIVVGDGDEQKNYPCYSQIMAMNSGYIDAVLTIPMREQQSMTLRFPEINPNVWEKMMSYLHSGAADPECVDDIRVVLPWYDKYDFNVGLELCDRVLGQIISQPRSGGSNLDESTAAIELLQLYVHRMKASTMHLATNLLLQTLQSGLEGRHSFAHRHICRFLPALRADDDVWNYAAENILRRVPVDRDRLPYVASLTFPDLLLTCIQAHTTLLHAKSLEKELLSLVTSLRVEVCISGADYADGVYYRDTKRWRHKKHNRLCIAFDSVSGWTIGSTLYVCSERPFNEILPPKTGWRPLKQTDPPQAAPILKYIVK